MLFCSIGSYVGRSEMDCMLFCSIGSYVGRSEVELEQRE